MAFIQDRLNLAGKVVVVTGSGQGIGRAMAIGAADAGAMVVVGEIDEATGSDTERTIRELGHDALFVPTDVRQTESIQNLVNTARSHFGRIDAMLNNAGGNFQLPALDISPNGFDAILRMNMKSMFFGSQFAARAMIEEGHGGAIVSTASVAGLQGSTNGIAPYAGAKAGIMGMTRALAGEWAQYGIRVNAVAPGAVATRGSRQHMKTDPHEHLAERVPLARAAQPEDIASAAIFLASDLAAYITGQVIAVDGGSSTVRTQ